MKKILLGLCIFIFSTSHAQTKYLSFSDGYVSPKKFDAPKKTITNSDSYIEVEYKFDGAYLKQISNGENKAYYRMFMDDALYTYRMTTTELYEPNRMPYYKDLLVLNESSFYNSAKIEIIKEEHNDYKCPFGNQDLSDISDESNYEKIAIDTTKKFNIKDLVKCITSSTFRNIPIVSVNSYPVWYDSNTNTLRCYTYIKYRVTWGKEDYSGNAVSTPMSKLAYDLLGRVSSNPEMLKKYDSKPLETEATSRVCDYLIVTIDAYKEAAERIASWKSRLGFKCNIFSKPKWERNNNPQFVADSIRKYCDNVLKCRPDYLLIIGSNNDVPAYKPMAPNTYCSDAPAARFDNLSRNDDIIRGRISVYSAKEAISVVDKIISYEDNPPVDSEFYNNALAVSLFYPNDYLKNYEDKGQDFFSEVEGINIDLKTLGYNVERKYNTQKEAIPQYYANGVKLSEELFTEELGGNDFWDKDSTYLTDLVNKGKVFVVYNGHGNETGYSQTYSAKEVENMKNGNKTPVFFNFTCSTGTFDHDEKCFAECLLNKENGGAVGVFGNSYPTIHGDSHLMASTTFESLFKYQDISVACAILQASLKTELDETRYIGHYFGDPSMRMYTVAPASFKPFISRGKDNSITVDSYVKGSKITVCSISDYGKSYYKTFDATNETRSVFENVSVPCYITITKANYVPYVTVSKTDLYLQNMALTGYHNIEANSIISGEKVTDELKEGAFVVESGMTKLTASKTLSLKSGTSVKFGASLRARKGQSTTNYKGTGEPRESKVPLCFSNFSDRFINGDTFFYDGNGGPLTSISDNSSDNNSVNIYPNPTSGRINVVVNNGNNINEVVVLDITGNVLMSESVNTNNISLDLSSFAKGLYLVKVVTAEDSFVKKVVLK